MTKKELIKTIMIKNTQKINKCSYQINDNYKANVTYYIEVGYRDKIVVRILKDNKCVGNYINFLNVGKYGYYVDESKSIASYILSDRAFNFCLSKVLHAFGIATIN